MSAPPSETLPMDGLSTVTNDVDQQSDVGSDIGYVRRRQNGNKQAITTVAYPLSRRARLQKAAADHKTSMADIQNQAVEAWLQANGYEDDQEARAAA